MKPRIWMLALAVSAGLCSVSFGQIKGTVKFDGTAPEPAEVDMAAIKECAEQHPDGIFDESLVVTDGKLQNVVVSIKPAEGAELKGELPKTPLKIDQKGCQYVPHVAAMMAGQEFIVANSDPFLHNVHSLALDNPAFNFGQPTVDPGKKMEPMKVEERFKIKCDVHPWMAVFVNVFSHPFFAVSKEDGTFEVPTAGLADGKYTLVAWHETLGEQEAQVEVKDGKADATFSFKAEAAAAEPVKGSVEVTLAAAQTSAEPKKACCSTTACKPEEERRQGQLTRAMTAGFAIPCVRECSVELKLAKVGGET